MNIIKRSICALTMALTVLIPITSQAAESMAPKHYQSCIEACEECVTACESCATACLNSPEAKTMADCIKMERDGADICTLCARFMARDST